MTRLTLLKSRFSGKDSPKSTNSRRKTGSKSCNRVSSVMKKPKNAKMEPHRLTKQKQLSLNQLMMVNLVLLGSDLVEEGIEANKLQNSKSMSHFKLVRTKKTKVLCNKTVRK